MPELVLLPSVTLTLTPNTMLVHTQPAIALLPSVTLTLVPFTALAITDSDWPSNLPQLFLADGTYSEAPFPSVMSTGTDSGVQKTRRRFTGKFTLYQGTMRVDNNAELDLFKDFYFGAAAQGNAFFEIPVPSGSGTKTVRFIPGSLIIVSDGGAGWHIKFQFQEKPVAI